MARVRLGIYLGSDECKLGAGKIRLLRAIREHGSISAAARSMGMAYRHAWSMVDELNRCFAEPVVSASIGGRAGGGAKLTEWGDELIARFDEIERIAHASIRKQVDELDRRIAGATAAPRRSSRRGPPTR